MTDIDDAAQPRARRTRPLEAPTPATDAGVTRPAPPVPPTPDEKGERPRSPLGLVAIAALTVLLGVTGGWSMLIVVFAIIVMIFLHELGHYVAAKRSGMKVTEFFIGFGPRIWSFRRGETEYGFKAIPAGAYVRIIGMNNLDEVDPADESRTYRQKAFHKRLSVAVAGSAMHFLIAVVSLFLLLAVFGLPGQRLDAGGEGVPLPWAVSDVTAEGAAAEAGVQPGDRILTVDGVAVADDFRRFSETVRARPGETVPVEIERDGTTRTLDVAIGETNPTTGEDVGFFGVGQTIVSEPASVPAAAVGSFREFGRAVVLTGEGLGRFFSVSGISDFVGQVGDAGGEDVPSVVGDGTGPVADDGGGSDDNRLISILGAAQIGSQATSSGLEGLLLFLVSINVSIGMINLIPLLPFDGGHVVVAVYEKIRTMLRGGRRYQADVAKLLPLTYAVVMVLVLVGVSAIYLDIADPIDLGGG
ncbi:MAG: site-2 protease family protein [Acidimicrobiales bacterium]